MAYPFILCDVFAARPFAGNPLAVFLDAEEIAETTMASLAKEFGWSEITFVTGGATMPRVRIWTPGGELPFAGHPTVGTAVVLASTGHIEQGWSTLQLGIGPVAVEVALAPLGGRATMTQRTPDFGRVVEDRVRLAEALGLEEEELVPDLPAQVVSTGLPHFLVPVRSLEALGRARPEPDLLPALTEGLGVRWAYVFCTDTPGTAAAARARLIGVGGEDPATGSAAGPLGAYLVHYGVHRAGAMDVEQGVEMGRPSRIVVDVPVEGGEIGSVRVAGEVHIWGRGELVDLPAPSATVDV
ncbi:MAG: PhzF family phenazine biosynthesis protein [Chloroflexi bacterium]|nr:PhzF family phenazine biosynthesis protein [Chloroflexota bacterium]